ncbi:alpha-L-fucosidase [Hallella multisaccharivorax]|uniref:alpha-L-fucosidase n=1 Tax=Hallella multisaccharivorax TaxID=310514 RepID=UPI00361DAF15
MKRLFIAITLLVLMLPSVAQKDVSLKLDPAKAQWFREAKFGMFIHWGLYSIFAGSYNGHTLPDATLPNGRSWYAEWAEKRLQIPDKVYRGKAREFSTPRYNPDEWVRLAKEAGMRYLVITAKHHDGFALWDSKVSHFDVELTPGKKDLLAPLVKACRKYGLKYGFYYSHWEDWEHPGGAKPEWEKQPTDAEYQKYWEEKSLPQVKELLVDYAPDLLWFDTWGSEGTLLTPARRDELIRLVRTYSKKCLINGRICYTNPGDDVDFLEMMDNEYPAALQDRPWQTPATMQQSWGYHARDYNWKPARQMLTYLVSNTSKGGNYLLNIGPKADGTLPLPAVRRLCEMGGWMAANGEAVYGTSPVHIEAPADVFLSQKTENGKHWLYVFLTRPMRQLTLPVKAVGGCQVLETGQPVDCTATSGGSVSLAIPDGVFRDGSIQVLKLEIE